MSTLKTLQTRKAKLEAQLATVNKQIEKHQGNKQIEKHQGNKQIEKHQGYHDHCFHIPVLGREAWCNTVVAYKCNCGMVRYISAYTGFALGQARPDGYRI